MDIFKNKSLCAVSLLILFFLVFGCESKKLDVIVIAHRGAPGYVPEHTLLGVGIAQSWGVDYVEPDVVLSKDSVPVILHDIHLETTTNVEKFFPHRKRKDGRYYAIDFTLKELKTLSVHERVDLEGNGPVFPKRFPLNSLNFKIPTLLEYINLIDGMNRSSKKNVGLYVEIKAPEFHLKEGKDILKTVYVILKERGYEGEKRAIIQCFYPETLKRLKNEFHSQIPRVLLIAENSWKESSVDYDFFKTKAGLREVTAYASGIGPWTNQIMGEGANGKVRSLGLVEKAHEAGLFVHPYTHRTDDLPPLFHSDLEFFDFLFKELKVDGLFSDFADRPMRYLGRL